MDTIRKVMAARSVQNVKSAVDIEMTAGSRSIVFMDLKAKKPIGQVSVWLSCSSPSHSPIDPAQECDPVFNSSGQQQVCPIH